MKSWVRPRTEVQAFEADDYVAACWYIACDYGQGENRHYDPKRGFHDAYEDGTGCGWEDNQVIRESSKGVFTLREEDGFGEDYDMMMTRNSNWSGLSSTLSGVTVGETIYWTTNASDGRIWYHKGQVETATNVNRS